MPLAPRPRALVTGAASGLGRALAVALASRGARVLAADLDLEGARETAEQVTRAGGEGHAAEADVTQAADVERLAREMDARFGGVDFVANNAGVAVAGPVGVVPLEDWRWAVGVNLWGVVHGCHVFVPRMRAQGAGHILNVASAAGLLSPPGLAPYNVTKAAVVSLSETLAGELYGSGVGVSVLCPTFFRTRIGESARAHGESPKKALDALMDRSKIQAPEVAELALCGCERGDLFVLPHGDGRWLWRLKRLGPDRFAQQLQPRALGRVRKRAERG